MHIGTVLICKDHSTEELEASLSGFSFNFKQWKWAKFGLQLVLPSDFNKHNIYRPQTKLREGNVFTGIRSQVGVREWLHPMHHGVGHMVGYPLNIRPGHLLPSP